MWNIPQIWWANIYLYMESDLYKQTPTCDMHVHAVLFQHPLYISTRTIKKSTFWWTNYGTCLCTHLTYTPFTHTQKQRPPEVESTQAWYTPPCVHKYTTTTCVIISHDLKLYLSSFFPHTGKRLYHLTSFSGYLHT